MTRALGRVLLLGVLAAGVWAKEGCLPDCRCANEGGYRVLDCGKMPTRAIPDDRTPTKLRVRHTSPVLYKRDIQLLRPRNVVELDLCNSGVQTLAPDALQHMPVLKVVKLSNNLITSIQISTFRFNEQLRDIYLDGNRIQNLEVGCFASLPHLQHLYLQHNNLSQIPKLPKQLNTVDLSYNDIKTIPETFEIKEDLKNMDLCGNPVTHIPKICLQHNNLTSLCLGDGNAHLQQGTGKQLRHIENITLSSEKMPGETLSEANVQELQGMTTLKHLTINHYTLNTLIFLHYMPHLETLTLQYDKTTGIGEIELLTALSGKPKLQELNLKGSKELAPVVMLSAGLWENLNTLRRLNVAECDLKNVQLSVLGEMQISVDLSGNPLHCDCQLLKTLKQVHLENGEHTVCHTPEQYADHPVTDAIQCSQGEEREEEPPKPDTGLPIIHPGQPDEQQNIGWRDQFDQQNMPGALKREKAEMGMDDEHRGLEDAEDRDEAKQPTLPDDDSEFIDKDLDKGFTETGREGGDDDEHEEHTEPSDAEGGHTEKEDTTEATWEHDKTTETTENWETDKEEEEGHDHEGGGTTEEVVGEEEGGDDNGEEEEEGNDVGHNEHHEAHHEEGEDNSTANTIIFVLVGVVALLALIAIIVFSVMYCRFKRKGHETITNAPLKSVKTECSSEDSLLKNLKK